MAQEQEAKHAAEEGLLYFIKWLFEKIHRQPFIVNYHHEVMAEFLEAIVNGEIPNGIINIPPRYSKTEMAVIGLVPWCYARNPQSNFIHLSYAESLVLDNSSRIRDAVKHEAYQANWPMKFREDTDSKGLWRNDQGGGFLAVQAGGTITGFGGGSTASGCIGKKFAGGILIDDPLKADDAGSEVEREKVNRRLNNTIISRRNNPQETPILVIMQRLHEEDMTGYIMAGHTPLKWEHLAISAERPNKQPLWPAKHNWADLQAMKKADAYTYSGQYLQRPSPEDGEYFKRNMFPRYERVPDNVNFYGASDYATKDGDGDYTVHGVCAVDELDNIYIVDWWRERTSTDVWVDVAVDMMEAWEPLAWGEEVGQIRNSMDPEITKTMEDRRVYCNRVKLPTTSEKKDRTAKMAKCRTIQSRMIRGKVFFPANAPWVEDLIEECTKFPNGKNDDQCDVLGGLGLMITKMYTAPEDKKPGYQPPKDFKQSSLDELYAAEEGSPDGRKLV